MCTLYAYAHRQHICVCYIDIQTHSSGWNRQALSNTLWSFANLEYWHRPLKESRAQWFPVERLTTKREALMRTRDWDWFDAFWIMDAIHIYDITRARILFMNIIEYHQIESISSISSFHLCSFQFPIILTFWISWVNTIRYHQSLSSLVLTSQCALNKAGGRR